MCGILGCNFNTKNFNNALHLLRHRGPDNIQIKKYKSFLFGHTRLSIIDLDKEANQPMEFDDLILIFNGEIYNYQELINTYNLDTITKSDSEVIIRMYQKFGEKCLNYLNGMFAFCIFDKKNKKFFCARDRFGKKPFFYYFKNNKFIFASEIKAILKILNYVPEMNYNALLEYLSFSSAIYENTFYNDIKKLPAGYCLKLDEKLNIEKYYDIDKINIEIYNEKNVLKKIEKLFFESVKLRLISDVNVATFLSGGIDSSLVSAVYAKISGKKINTYSIGYNEYLYYSELDYAKIVANHINSNHTEIVVSKEDYLNNIEKMLYFVDEPFGDSATIPTMILSEIIHKDGIKVALSGEGSDEIFMGYDNYFNMFAYFNGDFKKEKFNLTKDWEYKYRKIKNKYIFLSTGEVFSENQKKLLLNKFNKIKLPYVCDYEPLRQMSYFDFKYWIENVLMTKIDRASMANSLEVRTPFLDYRLVEFMFKMDNRIKKGDTNKYLLKKIAIKYLPKEIVYRKKKGFSSPFIEWLFDEYKDKLLYEILYVNKKTNFFKEEFVKFLYNEAKEKRFKQHFYNLYIFARWFKKMYL